MIFHNFSTQFFDQLKKFQGNYKLKHPHHEFSLYPLLRLIFANDEHERVYNLQEYRLKKLLQKTLQLQPGSKNFQKIETCNDNDLADTIFEVVSDTKIGTLTVAEVDNALNLMTKEQTKQFSLLFQKASAVDLKWYLLVFLNESKLIIIFYLGL